MASESPYLYKQVSLLSTSDVRYDGRLYIIDLEARTIALQHVRCLGTEGRRTGDQAISPSECTYEFIIFRAENIKQLKLTGDGERDLTQELLEPLRHGKRGTQSQSKAGGRTSRPATERSGDYRAQYASQSRSRGAPEAQPQSGRAYSRDRDSDRRGYGYQSSRYPSSGQAPAHSGAYHSQPQGPASKRRVGMDRPAGGDSRGYDGGVANGRHRSGGGGYAGHGRAQGGGGSRQVYYGNGGTSYYERQAQAPPAASRSREGRSYDPYYRQNRGHSSYSRSRQYGYDDRYGRQARPQYRYDTSQGGRRPYPRQYTRYGYQQGYSHQSYGGYGRSRPYAGGGGGGGGGGYRGYPRGGRRQSGLKAGTGEFLGDRRLIGSEINISKDMFDFETAKEHMETLQEAKAAGDGATGTKTGDADDTAVSGHSGSESEVKNEEKTSGGATGAVDATVSRAQGAAYDKDEDFFDQLTLDTQLRPTTREERQDASKVMRETDASTFGTVGTTYRSKHRRPFHRQSQRPRPRGYAPQAQRSQMQGQSHSQADRGGRPKAPMRQPRGRQGVQSKAVWQPRTTQ